MDNLTLSKLYMNFKKCPRCRRVEQGILLDNGLIRLPCGVTTNADRRWVDYGNGLRAVVNVNGL